MRSLSESTRFIGMRKDLWRSSTWIAVAPLTAATLAWPPRVRLSLVSGARSVAVVIPSWNTLGLLPRCLASIGRQGTEVELMVVDNGSTDGSVAYLEREG